MKKPFLILPLILTHSALMGANYYLHADMPVGTSWTAKTSWFNDPTAGTDMGTATFGGNHFYLNGWDLRTGNIDGISSFNGSSLNFASSAERLQLMATTTNILQALNVSNGDAYVHSSRSVIALSVTTLNSSGTFSFRALSSSQGIDLVVTSLAGAGDLVFGNKSASGVDAGSYSINVTDATAFSGRLLADDGVLTIVSANFSQATLYIYTGDANKTGVVNIGTSATFAAIESASVAIAPGTYTAAELNALFSSASFTGAGTLTVVPEPSTFALLAGLLALGLVVRRRC